MVPFPLLVALTVFAAEPSYSVELRALLEWNGLEASPLTVHELEQVAKDALNNGRLDEATRTEVLVRRGIAHAIQQHTALAQQDFDDALQRAPHHGDIAYWMGRTYLLTPNTYNTALRWAVDALHSNPKDAKGYVLAGLYYSATDDESRALDYFNQAIDRDPNRSLYFMYRAGSHLRLGQFESCIKDVDRAITLPASMGADSIPTLMALRGRALLKQRKYAEAEISLHRALALGPNDSMRSMCDYWLCLAMQHKAVASVVVAQRFLKANPEDAIAHGMCCLSQIQVGEIDKAFGHAQHALARDRYATWTLSCRARALEGMGEWKAAAEDYERIYKTSDRLPIDFAIRFAFLLSTCPDANARNGAFARSLMTADHEKLDEAYQRRMFLIVRSLTEAEVGDFEAAIQSLDQVIAAESAEDELANICKALKTQFENRRPYRFDPQTAKRTDFHIPATYLFGRLGGLWK